MHFPSLEDAQIESPSRRRAGCDTVKQSQVIFDEKKFGSEFFLFGFVYWSDILCIHLLQIGRISSSAQGESKTQRRVLQKQNALGELLGKFET